MAVNLCKPCSDPCVRSAAVNTEEGFRAAILNILCSALTAEIPDESSIARIAGTYTGSNQVVLAAPGAGKIYVVRLLRATTEDTNTDFQFFSRTAGGVNTAIGPNSDYIANAGDVLPDSKLGWFATKPNESLVVTTSGGAVDLLGAAEIRTA